MSRHESISDIANKASFEAINKMFDGSQPKFLDSDEAENQLSVIESDLKALIVDRKKRSP
jgi:hypothetical protein